MLVKQTASSNTCLIQVGFAMFVVFPQIWFTRLLSSTFVSCVRLLNNFCTLSTKLMKVSIESVTLLVGDIISLFFHCTVVQ